MIEVIPTCVDTEQFNLSFSFNKKDKIVLCQIGTIQTRYNVHFTFKFFKELNKTYNTKIIFINKNERKKILDLCKKYNSNVHAGTFGEGKFKGKGKYQYLSGAFYEGNF